jgi:hypothetical protein
MKNEGGASVEVEQNLSEVVGHQTIAVDAGDSKSMDSVHRHTLPLDDFFARPVEIANFPIAVGAVVTLNYDIWDLYSLNPAVRAKFRNYAYFRGDLHVRVSISGTPFHYGRVMLSYQPLASSNVPLVSLLNQLLTFADTRPLLINYLSQSDGAVSVDVKSNQPVDIHCPFISTKPMFRLYNSATTVIADTTSFDDFENAGKLFFQTINTIGSVSTTPSALYVQIYAWATNVKLGTATGTNMDIMTEAGRDEREVGPVEKFSTGAAQVSAALTVVPKLAPFALASELAFTTLGEMASLFGWSRPVLIDDPVMVKNRPFSNGAQTIGPETSSRITLDPKQELVVDGTVVGVEDDDMTIVSICRRPTYLTTFTWADDKAVMNTMWLSQVHPRLETIMTNSLDWWYQPTAMAFATRPFAYWRGTITFRFEIVASSFQRQNRCVLRA